MKLRMVLAGITFAAGAAMLTPAPARAVNLDSAVGTWSDVVGDAGVASTVQFLTVNGENQVKWGDPATTNGQSGLGFKGVAPPTQTFALETDFIIGALRHFNQPVYPPAATGVKLTLDLDFTDPTLNPAPFVFQFGVDETTNSTGNAWLDRDFITFPNPFSTTGFLIGNTIYTLKLTQFQDVNGNVTSSFESPEGGTNLAYLVGRITSQDLPPEVVVPPDQPQEPPAQQPNDAVPEPLSATLSVLALTALGLSAARRRRA